MAVAVPPPNAPGRVAVIVAVAGSKLLAVKLADTDPAEIVTELGTVTLFEEDDSATVVLLASAPLIVAVNCELRSVEQLLGGANEIPSAFTVSGSDP